MYIPNLIKFVLVLALVPPHECKSPVAVDVSKSLYGIVINESWHPHVLAVYKYHRGIGLIWKTYDRNAYPSCTAASLTPRWIISPCHCLTNWYEVKINGKTVERMEKLNPDDPSHRVTVTGGSTVLGDYHNPSYQTRDIKTFLIHAHCEAGVKNFGLKNDIAAGYLKEPFPDVITLYGPNASYYGPTPIQFWSHNKERAEFFLNQLVSANVTCFMAGYGYHNWTAIGPEIDGEQNFRFFGEDRYLREVEQRINFLPRCIQLGCIKFPLRCTALYKAYRSVPYLQSMMCGFRRSFRRGGPCIGDSGSTLMCGALERDSYGFWESDNTELYAVGLGFITWSCGLGGTLGGGPTWYLKFISYWDFLALVDERFLEPRRRRSALEMVKKCPQSLGVSRGCQGVEEVGEVEKVYQKEKGWASTLTQNRNGKCLLWLNVLLIWHLSGNEAMRLSTLIAI